MTTTTTLILIAAAGWLVAAVALGVLIGLSIRQADRRSKQPIVPNYPPVDDDEDTKPF